jgi:predicted molibdopterin-dependent oxidoreductase YjgC
MSRFSRLPEAQGVGPLVTVDIEGETVRVPAGESVAAAVLAHGLSATRTTPVSDAPRGPLCMMGVCFECLMEIDGVPNRQACQVPVAEGMRIRRQRGAGG